MRKVCCACAVQRKCGCRGGVDRAKPLAPCMLGSLAPHAAFLPLTSHLSLSLFLPGAIIKQPAAVTACSCFPGPRIDSQDHPLSIAPSKGPPGQQKTGTTGRTGPWLITAPGLAANEASAAVSDAKPCLDTVSICYGYNIAIFTP